MRPSIPLRDTPAVLKGEQYPPTCEHGEWTFAGADYGRKATKWRCPRRECKPASRWIKADRLHPLIPRERRSYSRSILPAVNLLAATAVSGLLAYGALGTYVHADSDLCGSDPDSFRCTEFVETVSFWVFWVSLIAFGALVRVRISRLMRALKRQRQFR